MKMLTAVGITGIVIGAGIILIALSRKGKQKPNNKILFIGDSITAGSNSYANLYKSQHPEKEIKIIAQVGAPTVWMREQLKNLLANNKYDAVVVAGGTNDAAMYNYPTGSQNAKSNLDAMVDMINGSGAESFLIVPPTGEYNPANKSYINMNVSDIAQWIRGNKKITGYSDFYRITNGNKNSLIDGIHPIADIQHIMSQQIENLV